MTSPTGSAPVRASQVVLLRLASGMSTVAEGLGVVAAPVAVGVPVLVCVAVPVGAPGPLANSWRSARPPQRPSTL